MGLITGGRENRLSNASHLAVRVVTFTRTEAPALEGTFKSGVGFFWIAYATGWDHSIISLYGLTTFAAAFICNVHWLFR